MNPRASFLLVSFISFLASFSAAQQAPCQPKWIPTFGDEGTDDNVRAFTVFDDGSGGGPALYVGGGFTEAGGVPANYVAKWDGTSWTELGSGLDFRVFVLAVFDDGSGGGPALYAGGAFTTAVGLRRRTSRNGTGSSWSPLGAPGGGTDAEVYALTVFDDGSGGGQALYVGGEFTVAGAIVANHIARWDGTSWSAPSGVNGTVGDLLVFDDGTGGGPALYAGGSFTTAGGLAANRAAKWDGTSWSALGSGLDNHVFALTAFDDGNGGGPGLYASGAFTSAGGVPANRIAKWDGAGWSALGSGMDAGVFVLTEFDDGTGGGPALYAGGPSRARAEFLQRITSRSGTGSAGRPSVQAGYSRKSAISRSSTTARGVGLPSTSEGIFLSVGGVGARHAARWDGSSWSALGDRGMSPVSGFVSCYVEALAVFDDRSGGGPALYAGGFFEAGAAAVKYVAKWEGATWSPLGNGPNELVFALTVFDDGGGPALYAGGRFTQAGGAPANYVAKWDGASWSPIGVGGNGTNYHVHVLEVFDDGTGGGPALYAGGEFTTAGGVAASRIAKWDGSSWSSLGSGVPLWSVDALAVFDDQSGGGPALYVGGNFNSAGGIAANRIAKWDGTTWSPLGSGISGFVYALTGFGHSSGGGPGSMSEDKSRAPAGYPRNTSRNGTGRAGLLFQVGRTYPFMP